MISGKDRSRKDWSLVKKSKKKIFRGREDGGEETGAREWKSEWKSEGPSFDYRHKRAMNHRSNARFTSNMKENKLRGGSDTTYLSNNMDSPTLIETRYFRSKHAY